MRWILFPLFLLLTAACSDFFKGPSDMPSGDPNAGSFRDDKMLANIGLNVLVPLAREFRERAEILEREIEGLCVGSDDRPAREAWRAAMLAFHRLDAVPVGPLAESGRALRAEIYGWPVFNACGVDLEVVKLSQGHVPPERLLYTMKGLGALEYLIFEAGLGTQCNPVNPNHRPAFAWAGKPDPEKRRDRCQYAKTVAARLADDARVLESAWNPDGGNFTKTLINGSRFASLSEAVNAMSDAMFSLEEVKDLRLGRPLGLHQDCSEPEKKCPADVEHRWSGLAVQAVMARLEGFAGVFNGTGRAHAGFGFDDRLRESGHDSVVKNVLSALNQAQATAARVKGLGRLDDMIRAMDPAACAATNEEHPAVPACLLHRHVRALSSVLKTEFLTALALKAPPAHQGDND